MMAYPTSHIRFGVVTLVALALLGSSLPLTAQNGRSSKRASRSQDYQAAQQLKRSTDLLAMGEEERGIKVLSSIPRLYPNSKLRFDAYMALGQYYVTKKQYTLATKQFNLAANSDNDMLIAEATYEMGKCYYLLSQYNTAFSYLRKVTVNYPNSVFANQAYYYIGQCHFEQKNWKKAIDALKMVGTAISQDDENSRYTEAGQRFFVKVHDKDLVVLAKKSDDLTIDVTSKRGDKEVLTLSILDRKGEYYVGSLPTRPGAVTPGNGILDVAGGDTIVTSYVDANTASGERMVKRTHETQVVSSGAVAFTDGAYENNVKGVYLSQEAFIKVRDLDHDRSAQRDTVGVRVDVRYVLRPEETEDEGRTGFDLGEQTIETRDSIRVDLVETGPHTGVFVAAIRLHELEGATVPADDDATLHAKQGDRLRVVYTDTLHIGGTEELDRQYEATLLSGAINDVMAQVRIVNDAELQAEKNLIEAKALLELATIFKKVGLIEKSENKAADGLKKADDVVMNRKLIPSRYVEEAMKTKWELYLVTDQLAQAVAVCRELMTLFPESTLVDHAMVKIGEANLEAGDFSQAISIFQSVTAMPKSSERAHAAFMIGEAYEKMAVKQRQQIFLNNAMSAYQNCANQYPDSNYAGLALAKMVDFYLKMKDFQRAADLVNNIVQDFPDLGMMDKLLLKGGIALYRLQRYQDAYERFGQLINEYPESSYAAKAENFRTQLAQRLDSAGQ